MFHSFREAGEAVEFLSTVDTWYIDVFANLYFTKLLFQKKKFFYIDIKHQDINLSLCFPTVRADAMCHPARVSKNLC